MNNTPLEWNQIPEEIKTIARKEYIGDGQLVFANEIMQAIKPIVEKAWEDGWISGFQDDVSSGTLYWNSLITNHEQR